MGGLASEAGARPTDDDRTPPLRFPPFTRTPSDMAYRHGARPCWQHREDRRTTRTHHHHHNPPPGKRRGTGRGRCGGGHAERGAADQGDADGEDQGDGGAAAAGAGAGRRAGDGGQARGGGAQEFVERVVDDRIVHSVPLHFQQWLLVVKGGKVGKDGKDGKRVIGWATVVGGFLVRMHMTQDGHGEWEKEQRRCTKV